MISFFQHFHSFFAFSCFVLIFTLVLISICMYHVYVVIIKLFYVYSNILADVGGSQARSSLCQQSKSSAKVITIDAVVAA